MRRSIARAAALLALMLAPAAAQAEWREARTSHFLIYSQASDAKLHKFAERLEGVHALMLMATGVKEEAHPYRVRVYVVGDTAAVQRYMEKPDPDVAGFYRPMTAGPVAFTPNSTGEDGSFTSSIVLFHEYAHHFMLQFFPSAYPAWYVEGWAEVISTASFEKPGTISYGKVADHRRYELAQGEHVPPSRLLTRTAKEMTVADRSGLYGSGWLLTHYLTFAPQRQGQLGRYLAAYNAGVAPAEAAKVFGDLRLLDREVSSYLASASFPYRQPPLPPGLAASITTRALAPDEAAMLPYQMEFTKPMKPDAAIAFAGRVEAAAAQFPAGAAAQLLRAEVDLDSGLLDKAGAAARSAVALAPQSARAHYILGAVLLATAEKDTSVARHGEVLAARREIIAANAIDPDDPLPLIAYYRSFGIDHVAASAAALAGLARAAEVVPQDPSTRLMYARELIVAGNRDRAIILLKPLAYDPHGGGGSAIAQKMLDRLEGRDKGDPLSVGEPEKSTG